MSIVQNKKAFHDYFIEQRFEAGIALEGWEVKAVRAGRVGAPHALRTGSARHARSGRFRGAGIRRRCWKPISSSSWC